MSTEAPRWRTGREDTRAVFRDGQCMGRMNETETAAVVVRVMNDGAAREAEAQRAVAVSRFESLRAGLEAALDDYDAGRTGLAAALADIREMLS